MPSTHSTQRATPPPSIAPPLSKRSWAPLSVSIKETKRAKTAGEEEHDGTSGAVTPTESASVPMKPAQGKSHKLCKLAKRKTSINHICKDKVTQQGTQKLTV
ncbi:hypothetical protein APHAL10511_006901 [Amanita phalloides]|nr:hypothetical protein APHAL10511_006901 [Amanita phalloides]